MELKDIRCIIAVVEHQTISRAAQSLYISQPALSQTIHRIETELGKPLFHRRGRVMVPTAECKLITEYGRKMLDAHDMMLYSAMHMQEKVEGTVSLGMSPFYARQLLPSLLKHFQQYYPQIELQYMDIGNSQAQEKEVVEGRIDCCLVPMYPASPEMDYLQVGEETVLLAVPREHPLARIAQQEGEIDIMQLRNEPFILHKERDKVSLLQDQLFAHGGFQPRTTHIVTGWDVALAFVNAGMGSALMTEMIISDYRPEEMPVFCRIKNIDMSRHFAMAYRRGRVLTPAMVTLYEVAKLEFARKLERVRQERQERSIKG